MPTQPLLDRRLFLGAALSVIPSHVLARAQGPASASGIVSYRARSLDLFESDDGQRTSWCVLDGRTHVLIEEQVDRQMREATRFCMPHGSAVLHYCAGQTVSVTRQPTAAGFVERARWQDWDGGAADVMRIEMRAAARRPAPTPGRLAQATRVAEADPAARVLWLRTVLLG